MRKAVLASASLGLAAVASLAGVTPAQAATGGAAVDNPGVIALTDSHGLHQCSAVLVTPEWALTWSDTARCGKSDTVTDAAGEHATITEHRYFHFTDGVNPTDPSKTQAMLVHLSKPLTDVKPARLSTMAPKAGEKLSIAAFNGPSGPGHVGSVGRSDVMIDGHHGWISWFDAPVSMTLDRTDAGAPLLRGDEVVGFLGLAEASGGDAEDISNVYDWVQHVTR